MQIGVLKVKAMGKRKYLGNHDKKFEFSGNKNTANNLCQGDKKTSILMKN